MEFYEKTGEINYGANVKNSYILFLVVLILFTTFGQVNLNRISAELGIESNHKMYWMDDYCAISPGSKIEGMFLTMILNGI